MFNRTIIPILLKAVAEFPAVALTGPRQSGKTTLLRQCFPEHRYVNLEAPDTLMRLRSDPRGFFADPSRRWLIDEAQRYPELFSYLQVLIDEHPQKGQFILSGSQNFLLSEKISQSLAGRIAILELLPLSYSEFISHPDMKKPTLWELLYHGGYPRPYQEHLSQNLWYNSYIRTYLERDVRDTLHIKDLHKFQIFLKLCAGRHGQLLNLNQLAQDCGISQPTAHHWLSVLMGSYLVFKLSPYHKNFSKRVVKSPKLYFYDSAIVCHLLGIESPEQLEWHTSRGALFEGWAITEWIKAQTALARQTGAYFWRDHKGLEVDLLIEQGENLTGIEIKSTMTFQAPLLAGLKKWSQLATTSSPLRLIYGGDDEFVFDGVQVQGWRQWTLDQH